MGSLGSDGEDELQRVTSITKNQKFTRKFLDDSASVPRKMRSAMKKRGRESVTPPLLVSGTLKASNGGHSRTGDHSKKLKLKKKVDNVSKVEEEVAKTLFSLAYMAKDNTNSMRSLRLKSSGKDGESLTPQEASKKSTTSVTVEPADCSSNLTESTIQSSKLNSSGDGKQSNLPISKPSSSTGANGVRLGSSPKQIEKMPTLDATPSRIQKGKQLLTFNENENNDLLLCLPSSPTVASGSQTQASLPQPNMPNLNATPSRIQISTQLAFNEDVIDGDLPLCPCSSPIAVPSSQTQASLPQPNMPNLDATPSRVQISTQLTFDENENNDLLLCPRSSPAVAPSSQTPASFPQPNLPNLDATPSGFQIGRQLTFNENENNDLPLCPRSSPTVSPSSQTQVSFPQSSTAQQTTSSNQPHYLYRPRPYEKNVITNQLTGSGRSTKSWKNCATHIHMSRLIEASKRAEKNGGLQVMNLGHRLSENSQTNATFNNITHSTAEKRQMQIQYQRLLRDQQRLVSMASSSSNSHKRGSEFLSLAPRDNTPIQAQSPSAMLSSLPRNGYLSSFAGNPSNAAVANQMYLSGMFGGPSNVDATAAKRLRPELDEHQKRMAQISLSQFHPGFNGPRLAIGHNGGTDSSSPLNYAQLLSQHFQSSLNSKSKGIMPHQQILAGNSSDGRRNYQLLSPGLGRKGAVFDPKSLQFQLLCDQQR